MPDSSLNQPADLERLAQERFGSLSDAEIRLLRAAPTGKIAYCGPSERDDDPNNNPENSDNWGSGRWISAELVRWLCVERAAKDLVDPRGVRAHAAGIRGKLDLSSVAVPFLLELLRCSLSDDVDIRFIEVPSIDLTGTSLRSLIADHAKTRGSIVLRDLWSKGIVQLRGACIGGNLECDGGRFQNPAKPGVVWSGVALDATSAKVTGAVLLRGGFAAQGAVRLHSAEIGGILECDGGRFQNPAVENAPDSGMALNADGLKVAGFVFLRNGFVAEGAVWLSGAEIGGTLECEGGKFQNPAAAGVGRSAVALNVEGARVARAVLLRNGFVAEGIVVLAAAKIGGNLDCADGVFQNPALADVAGSGMALIADGARVGGAVLLCRKFSAAGQVRLHSAEIGGALECDGGKFQNPAKRDVAGSGTALTLEGATVAGAVLLRDGFAAEGQVRLSSAEIGGNLVCDGGKFRNPTAPNVAESGIALNADSTSVAGTVYLRNGFTAEGQVSLSSAKIAGSLICDGGKFLNPTVPNVAESGIALNAEGARVSRAVYLRGGFTAQGTVRLLGASIVGNLECHSGTFESLNLVNASAGAILDDEESWPRVGHLFLDGFTYGRISYGPASAQRRLRWLARESSFRTQPYRQLAKLLKEAGDDQGWRHVCAQMERKKWERENWIFRPAGWLLEATIGYGYFSMRALGWLLALVMIGAIVYWPGYEAGSMVPTNKEAYEMFEANKEPPAFYGAFYALAYSMENSFPLVKLGVQDKWTPGPDEQGPTRWPVGWTSRFLQDISSPRFLRWFRWGQICLGWILATLFVGGVSGVIRKD